jgi:hypothetical protein
MELKNKRSDEEDVPPNPHFTKTCSLELAENRYIEVHVYNGDGESDIKCGTVTDTFYEKFENENGKEFTIVMSPSGRDSPVLRSEDGDEGWIYRICQQNSDGVLSQIIYDEENNMYPSPRLSQDVLNHIDKLEVGHLVTVETDTGECITGTVTELDKRKNPTEISINNGVTTYTVHYPAGAKLQRSWEDGGDLIGDIVNVTVEYKP